MIKPYGMYLFCVILGGIMRLLVVENEGMVLRLLVRVLRGAGWEVLTASNGEDLIVVWKNNPCDAILSDVNMPGRMDGLEACAKIRNRDPHARIFMMTSDWDEVSRVEGCGFPVALRKPFTVEEIRDWSQGLVFRQDRSGGLT